MMDTTILLTPTMHEHLRRHAARLVELAYEAGTAAQGIGSGELMNLAARLTERARLLQETVDGAVVIKGDALDYLLTCGYHGVYFGDRCPLCEELEDHAYEGALPNFGGRMEEE